MNNLTHACGLDPVQTGDGAGRYIEAATALPGLLHDLRVIEQRPGTDHHEILAGGEHLASQTRHDGTTRGFDDQVRTGDQLLLGQIARRIL